MLRNIASDGGAVFYVSDNIGDSGTYANCTMKDNSAFLDGGAVHGGGSFFDTRFIGNYATNGGQLYATVTSMLTRCVLAEGGAPQKGAGIYAAAAIIVVDSFVHNFSAAASGDSTTIVYITGVGLSEFEYVTWQDNDITALEATVGSPVVMRNCEGLTSADVHSIVTLYGCDFSAIGDYCPPDYCFDTMLGIACYCYPDGVKVDPHTGSCAGSAQIIVPMKVFDVFVYKAGGICNVTVLFTNAGDLVLLFDF